MPYNEQQPLFDKIDLSQPWDSPRNAPHFKEVVTSLLYPRSDASRDERGFAVSHYTANVLVLGGDQPRGLDGFPDGAASTLLAGEAVSEPRAWGHPAHWRDPRLGINKSPEGFGGPLRGSPGAQFAMADGSVRFLSADIDPRVLAALATTSGGEKIDERGLEVDSPPRRP